MKTVIIIPARYASSRLPGKPLKIIKGKSLLERVYNIAVAASSEKQVFIATDNQEIADHAESFSAQVLMTPEECKNGSERVKSAVDQLKNQPEIIVNFQGDAVLTPPDVLRDLIKAAESNDYLCTTPILKIDNAAYEQVLGERKAGVTSGTYVALNQESEGIYFSKNLLPCFRDTSCSAKFSYRHVGIYAYTYQGLAMYLELSPTPNEMAEKLEQLRLIDHGQKIKCVEVDLQGRSLCSVDEEQDIARAEALIEAEGELL